jgi:hypothetical protein
MAIDKVGGEKDAPDLLRYGLPFSRLILIAALSIDFAGLSG